MLLMGDSHDEIGLRRVRDDPSSSGDSVVRKKNVRVEQHTPREARNQSEASWRKRLLSLVLREPSGAEENQGVEGSVFRG